MPATTQRGFTLLELMVVLAIVALALGLVLQFGPSRASGLSFDVAVHQVTGALRVAHARAIAHGRPTSVTFSASRFQLEGDAPIVLGSDIALSGDPIIHFLPDGGSSGGHVTLRTEHRQATIGVDWLTGRLHF